MSLASETALDHAPLPLDFHPTFGARSVQILAGLGMDWPTWQVERSTVLIAADLGELRASLGPLWAEGGVIPGDELLGLMRGHYFAPAVLTRAWIAEAREAARASGASVPGSCAFDDLVDALQDPERPYVQIFCHEQDGHWLLDDGLLSLAELERLGPKLLRAPTKVRAHTVNMVSCRSSERAAAAFAAVGVPYVESIVSDYPVLVLAALLRDVYVQGLVDGRAMSTALGLAHRQLARRQVTTVSGSPRASR